MNNKYVEIFNYLRQCPQLSGLWSIAGTEEQGNKIVLPQGASQIYQYVESINIMGGYECEMIPYPSIYEDYRINCYTHYDPADSTEPQDNVNVLELESVQAICDWINEQNENDNLPNISGKDVISIECNPVNPQVAYVNYEESTIAYFLTVRVYYRNTASRKCRAFNGNQN